VAATYAVQRYTGVSPGSAATITNCRLRTDDANTSDLTNPCIIDTVKRYSYWASINLNITGTFTQVSNIRHYSAGDLNTWTLGTTGMIARGNRDSGDIGCPLASYQQALGTAGTTGYSIADAVNGHTYYNGQTTKTTNLNSDTSGSPATIDTSLYTTNPSNTKFVVIQAVIDTDATQGVMSAKTLTFKVDEI